MRRFPVFLGALGLIAIFAWSCDDDSVRPSLTFTVSGQVDGYPCWCSYLWFNGDPRYTVSTGKYAGVTFVDEHGGWWGNRTDDSSRYRLDLPAGTYRAIVETPHSWPDTFTNITINRDTTVDLCIVLDWHSPDTISARFYYGAESDSLSVDSETVLLDFLQGQLRDLIDVADAERQVTYYMPPNGPMNVNYRIPIGAYPMWFVFRQAEIVVAEYQEYFPQNFEVSPDILLCLYTK
jgi:hypothetical protein